MLYKRGRIWWTEFEHAGARHRLSTGETDSRRAAKKARRLRVEVEDETGPGGRQRGVALDLLEALDLERVEQMGLKGRDRTIKELWAPLLRHLGARRDITELRVSDIDLYEGARRAEGVRGQTIRREVQALVRGLRLAKRAQPPLIRVLPFDPDDLRTITSDPPLPAQQAKEWAALEIAKVLDRLSKKAVTAGIRDQMRLVQLTGLRLAELKRLRPSWVVRGKLHVPAIAGAKTKRPRDLPLTPEAKAIIRKWAKKARDRKPDDHDPRLFARGKPNKALADASERARMAAVLTPRDIRAWYITHAGRHDPAAAQRLAGHTSIATTNRYLHADSRRILAAARAAAEAAGAPTRRSPQRKDRRRKA